MEKVVLKATKRDVIGKKVGALRRKGKLPAVLYGHRIETTAIMLDAHEGSQTLSHLTSSSLVTIDLDGKEYLALVREKQRDFIKNRLIHLDFQVVSLTEKMHAKVGIELTGTAPAVKDFNAVIHTGLTEMEVECMPQDLPERIVVNISGLAELGDAVRVRDVVLSDKVKILGDLEEAQVEEEAAPEVIEPGKKE
jgi:large subunit ribosomal protein L25